MSISKKFRNILTVNYWIQLFFVWQAYDHDHSDGSSHGEPEIEEEWVSNA
jgi:hypothetical protein